MYSDRKFHLLAALVVLTLGALALTAFSGSRRDKEVQARFAQLEQNLGVQQDMQAIRRLQYTYNYYNSSRMYSQLLSLVSENAEFIEIGGRGVYYGKEGFAENFHPDEEGVVHDSGMEFGNVLFQLAGQDVITVAPDRQTAKARVRVLTSVYLDFPDTVPRFNGGDYEMGYVNENGQWLISSLKYVHVFSVTFNKEGGVDPRYSTAPDGSADAPTTWYHPWPETGTLPFHFPNPTTGEPSPDVTGETRYWIGNWPGEFGKTGHR